MKTRLPRFLRRAVCLALISLALGVAGCDSWKRADTAVGLIAVPNVDTDRIAGRQVIRMRGRLARVTIDPVGARVIGFHAGRRPKWFSEKVEPNSLADPKFRYVERPQKANVLREPGWFTTVEGCAALDRSSYWQVEAWGDHLVLLSDKRCGLRWRKTFDLHRASATLDITVELENATGKPVPHGEIASRVATDGELVKDEDRFAQHAIAGDQRFQRQQLGWPVTRAEFTIPAGTIKGFGRLRWRERWTITDASSASPPSSPDEESATAQPVEGR